MIEQSVRESLGSGLLFDVAPVAPRRPGALLRGMTAKKQKKPAGKKDCFQTPAWALDPLLPHLTRLGLKAIWEPACGDCNLVRGLHDRGFGCIGSDILSSSRCLAPHAMCERDFLTWEPEGAWDVQVTNPPFSLAEEWVERSYALGRPFALLMPLYALGGQRRIDAWRKDPPQLIVFRERIPFDTPTGKTGKDSSPQFDVAWYCVGFDMARGIDFWSLGDERTAR